MKTQRCAPNTHCKQFINLRHGQVVWRRKLVVLTDVLRHFTELLLCTIHTHRRHVYTVVILHIYTITLSDAVTLGGAHDAGATGLHGQVVCCRGSGGGGGVGYSC